MHQVPVLVDGEFVLTESRAILAYLINKFKPGDDLYPTEPKARAIVDQRLYYDATVVFESNAQIIVSIKMSSHPKFHNFVCFLQSKRLVLYQGIKKIPTENREKLVNTLNVLDGFLSQSKWIAGNEKTIADFSVLGTITTVKVFDNLFYPQTYFSSCAIYRNSVMILLSTPSLMTGTQNAKVSKAFKKTSTVQSILLRECSKFWMINFKITIQPSRSVDSEIKIRFAIQEFPRFQTIQTSQ